MTKNRVIQSITALFLVAVFTTFFTAVSADQNLNSDNITRIVNASHASDAAPDYETVFPDDEIRELYITISPESWQAMQDDMEKNYGEFGNRTMPGTQGKGGPGRDIVGGNRTPGQGGMMVPGNPGQGMMMQEDPIYVPATISCNGEIWDHVALRYKGFNSLMSAWSSGIGKINMKLNMDYYEEEYPDTKDQKFYGFKELNLQAGLSDKTAIREKLTPEVFRDAGVPAPETAFYRVYLDHGDGSEYFGLYTLAEAVDDTVIETQFSNGDGNLYKPDGQGASFAEGKLNLSDFEKKSNEDEGDYSDIETLYNTLHSDTRNTSPETWRSDLESVFDAREFLTWLATNTLIQNWDTYGGNSKNYYLYNNPDTGTFSWIPWDNNYAFMEGMGGMNGTQQSGMNIPPEGFNMTLPGIHGMPGAGDMSAGTGPGLGPGSMGGSVSFSMENVTEQWPLIRYLMDDPVYHAKYLEILKQVLDTSFNPEDLEEKIDSYHDLISSSVIGSEGEREGYTYLTNDSEFDTAYEEMKSHISSQYDQAMAYLKAEGIE